MSQRTRTPLIYGLTGQLVEMHPPEFEVVRYGPPTSAATYSVWRGTESNDAAPVLTGTATLDTVATTVSVASGYSLTNRRSIELASSAGTAPGRDYCLTNAAKQREVVTLANTGTVLWNELAYDHAIGATFRGLRHYFTIDATFIATASNINAYGAVAWVGEHAQRSSNPAPPYRVRWVYSTADEVTRQTWTYFDVVRQAAKHSVTANELRALFPQISEQEWRESRGQQFAAQINAAWDRFVFDLRCYGLTVDFIRDQPMLDELVRWGALAIIAAAGLTPPNRDPETYVREAREQYERMVERAVPQMKLFYDAGGTGAITPDPPRQPWLRR